MTGLLSHLPSLLTVDLSFNYLLSVGNSVFTESLEVRTLDFQHNVLYEIAEDAFKPLQKLTELRLSHNFLHRVSEQNFQHNIALTELYLDNNHVRSLENESLKGLPRLKKLDLQKLWGPTFSLLFDGLSVQVLLVLLWYP